ncbi:hypothetical protein L218DRAFT_946798 [Marasmius fiardii PR-910]|nr:hypothetical protein L218DRAFT_946798 [Marasmius fiardii PR-910]
MTEFVFPLRKPPPTTSLDQPLEVQERAKSSLLICYLNRVYRVQKPLTSILSTITTTYYFRFPPEQTTRKAIMFSAKVVTLFIVSMMMTSTAVVARPEVLVARQGSTAAQMAFAESAPEDNSKTVHATSATRSMGHVMIMAAWVSTKFAPVERSKGALVTDLLY